MKESTKGLWLIVALAFFINFVVSSMGTAWALLFEAPWDITGLLSVIALLSFFITRASIKKLD